MEQDKAKSKSLIINLNFKDDPSLDIINKSLDKISDQTMIVLNFNQAHDQAMNQIEDFYGNYGGMPI